MKKLTHELIAMKTRCDRIENVKNLNLWGNDLDEIGIIRTLPCLEVVSLSVNKIRTLKDFQDMKNLKEELKTNIIISDFFNMGIPNSPS